MRCSIRHSKRETCVRAHQLAEFIFHSICSPNLVLFSNVDDFGKWAEFNFAQERNTFMILSSLIRNNTMKTWPGDVMMLFDNIVSKLYILHNAPDRDINDVIAFKIEQYKILWKMPHVILRNPRAER